MKHELFISTGGAMGYHCLTVTFDGMSAAASEHLVECVTSCPDLAAWTRMRDRSRAGVVLFFEGSVPLRRFLADRMLDGFRKYWCLSAPRVMPYRLPKVRLEAPLVIVGAPRSGTTLVFETLRHSTGLWTIGGESHGIIEGAADLRPFHSGRDSNRLSASDASVSVRRRLVAAFLSGLRDHQGKLLIELPPGERPRSVRLLEKTPKNALRIPFLNALFPGCRFVFVYREPRACISSIIEGWQSHAFVTYPTLPKSRREAWSFLLPPGWRRMATRSVAEIATFQWCSAVRFVLSDLGRMPVHRSCIVDYAAFVEDPSTQIGRICAFAGLAVDDSLRLAADRSLPWSGSTLRPPAPEKWRSVNPGLRRLDPAAARLAERAERFAQKRRTASEPGPRSITTFR
jgi:hypothetical protein